MARELRNIIYLLICFLIILQKYSFAAMSEEDYFKKINSLSGTEKRKELAKAGKDFFKEYPNSKFIADVRFILAENEPDPVKAIDQYKIIVSKYKYYKKNGSAQYKICEILYLQSKWKDLKEESERSMKLFPGSKFNIKFQFFLAKAYIHLEEYEKAKKVCLDIIKRDHAYNNLSDSLILLSYINRNMYGLSRSYLYSLNEIITGFDKSNNMPAALYLLGRYYESKAEYNKAFSAYSDVIAKFPRSPEAGFSKNQIDSISQYNPSKTDYLPDKDAIKKTDKIDIEPEADIEDNSDDKKSKNKFLYSISLGPFTSINNAREIKNLINKEFRPIKIAEIRNGYTIYTGSFSTIDSAIRTKVRLAEEFGINGNIVKIFKDTNKLFIYEE